MTTLLSQPLPSKIETASFGTADFRAKAPFNGVALCEERDQSGEIASRYQIASSTLGFDLLRPSQTLVDTLENRPLGDSIKIAATPLILTKNDAELIRAGTAQLIKVLTCFFEDVVLKEGRCMGERGVIPRALLREILSSSPFGSLEVLRDVWKNRCTDSVRFTLRPDLMRCPDGTIRIMELNIGNLGGLGDCAALHAAWLRMANANSTIRERFSVDGTSMEQLMRPLLSSCRPNQSFLTIAVEPQAESEGEKRTDDDNESFRMESELENLDIAKVPHRELIPQLLTFRNDPFILNIREGDGVLKYCSNGMLLDIFRAGGCDFLNAPGVDSLLGNKLLLAVLPSLARFYLGEELLLPIVPSCNLELSDQKSAECNYSLFPAFGMTTPFAIRPQCPYSDMVYKIPTSNRGEGVYFSTPANRSTAGMYFSLRVAQSAMATMKNGYFWMKESDPYNRRATEYFVQQPLVSMSTLCGSRVDMCPLAIALGRGESVVGEVPWARTSIPDPEPDQMTDPIMAKMWEQIKAFSNPSALFTNVSKGAHELPVWVER